MARPMAEPLAEAAWQGARLVWQAVRRHLNTAANEIATWALQKAHELLRTRRPAARVFQGQG
eukprot:9138072-Alexandrium_andersonii.AAC.1